MQPCEHVTVVKYRHCETRWENEPNFEEIRERSGDRLSGLALKGVRVRELWPDIEDVTLEPRGKKVTAT